MAEKICPHCGAAIDESAARCYACKAWLNVEATPAEDKPQEFLPTLLFAYFWGCFGIHRFYTGDYAIGIAQVLTLGGCFIWSYADFIMICFNKYKDNQGRYLRNYDKNIGIVAFVVSLLPLALILFMIMGIMAAIVLPSVIR